MIATLVGEKCYSFPKTVASTCCETCPWFFICKHF